MKTIKQIHVLFIILLLVASCQVSKKTTSYNTKSDNRPFDSFEWADTIQDISFSDTIMLKEWCHKQLGFSVIRSSNFIINQINLKAILIYGGSGISYCKLCIFQKYNNHWALIAEGNTCTKEQVLVKQDNNSLLIYTDSK